MTYLYCLVRSARKPAIRRAGGLPRGGPVRALDAGRGLWLIVSDVKAADYGEPAIAAGLKRLEWVSRCGLAHEAVVERFLSAAAVVPMQLFTIFTTDERALAHVARQRRQIERTIARVEGHLEWGLRLTWDEEAARAAVETAHAGRAHETRSGASYLARKRDLLEVNRTQLASARSDAVKAHRALATQASHVVRRRSTEQTAPGARLLVDAAYLVPVRATRAFRAAVRERGRLLAREAIRTTLTGPWPPYNFVAQK